jgi:negative regulator of flagellin synthesis FlgM
MEIPGNDFRIKNNIAQEKSKIAAKEGVKKPENDVSSVRGSGGKGTSASEQVNLSSKARDIQRAAEVVRSTPDIRTDRVNKIKKEIENGTYKPDSDVIAEKILKDIITESSFLR